MQVEKTHTDMVEWLSQQLTEKDVDVPGSPAHELLVEVLHCVVSTLSCNVSSSCTESTGLAIHSRASQETAGKVLWKAWHIIQEWVRL